MLQDEPVRNLQYESDLRIAQQPHVEPTIYQEGTVITSIPRPNQERQPISTVEIGTATSRSGVPLLGLNALLDMPSVHIEQTFELNEALTSIASENRYTIRSPLRNAIYAATESSTSNGRMLWGSARPFQMHLLDKTHQEALTFRKKFAIGIMGCQPRSIEVWAPPGDLIGRVVEGLTPFSSEFTIENGNREIMYQIEGPNGIGCCMPKEAYFKVYTPDLKMLKGSITRIWATDISQYTSNIYFSDTELTVKSKALFIAAAFLLEYLYFQ